MNGDLTMADATNYTALDTKLGPKWRKAVENEEAEQYLALVNDSPVTAGFRHPGNEGYVKWVSATSLACLLGGKSIDIYNLDFWNKAWVNPPRVPNLWPMPEGFNFSSWPFGDHEEGTDSEEGFPDYQDDDDCCIAALLEPDMDDSARLIIELQEEAEAFEELLR